MALSIGNVNFGVDANTAGLRKAITQLDAFKRKVDQVAKGQSAQAQATARAMSRQESAIKGAFQQVLRLRQQFSRLEGTTPSDLAKISQAFSRLTKEMTSGRLSTIEFTRSLDAFNATMGRSRRRLSDLRADEAAKRLGGLAKVIRNLESASVLAVGPLSGLGSRIRALASITSRTKLSLAAFFGVVTGGIVVLAKLSAAAVRAHKTFEQAEARFLASSGSLSLARKEMKFVIDTSRELGLRIDTSAKSFSRLVAATRGTALEGEGTRKIFLGISKAAAALRLGNIEVEGTFRAIEQIVSKGSVQAEELRGQLGERLPGAFRIAAESMGKTTRELSDMLKTGQLLADDFLPKFIKALEESFGERAKANVDSFQGSVNNLSNAALLFAKHFDEVTGISKVVIGAIQGLTKVIDFLREHLITLAKVLGAVAGAMLALAAPMILRGVVGLAKGVIGLTRAVLALNVALLANPIGRVTSWIIKLGAVIGGAIAGWFGMKKAVELTDEQLKELEETLDDVTGGGVTDLGELTEAFNELRKEVEETTEKTKAYQQTAAHLRGSDFVTPVVSAFRDLGGLSDLNIDKILTLANTISGPLSSAYDKVLSDLANAKGPEQTLLLFQTLQQAMKLNQKELAELAASLGKALGRKVNADLTSVTVALYQVRQGAIDAEEAFKAFQDSATNTRSAFGSVAEQLGEMANRLKALREGPESAKFFDDVTSKVMDFRNSMDGTNISMETRNRLADLYRTMLIETIALEEKYDRERKAAEEQERQREKIQRERIRHMERVQEVLGETSRHFNDMRDKIAAIAQGPRSLQIFEEIQEPLNRMREKLIEAGVPLPVMNAKLAEYKAILEELVKTQNLATGAASQTADAITNSLEDMITLSNSVKDSLKQLAQELFRIFLRAKLLDPLRDSLVGAFTGLFGGKGPAGPLGPPRAAGGDVRPGLLYPVNEKGVEYFSPKVTGTIVPHHRLGGMGGGVNLTINAPGADAGTVARIKEIVRTELGPQMVKAATQNTMNILRRPRFA